MRVFAWALLTGSPVTGAMCGNDVDYATQIARAFNDFTADHWLATDERFRCAMLINPRDPEAAGRVHARVPLAPPTSA